MGAICHLVHVSPSRNADVWASLAVRDGPGFVSSRGGGLSAIFIGPRMSTPLAVSMLKVPNRLRKLIPNIGELVREGGPRLAVTLVIRWAPIRRLRTTKRGLRTG